MSLNIGLYDVVPASLGLSNANDPMTITGEMKGTVPRPEIDGSVALKELHIPGLSFTKVQGNYHYANGLIALQDVTGSVFGGTLDAYGLYHFDNRHYQIDVKAKDLMAAVAAKNALINCQVDLDIKFRYLGKNANNITYGTFSFTMKTTCEQYMRLNTALSIRTCRYVKDFFLRMERKAASIQCLVP